jgi:hypothetical protein
VGVEFVAGARRKLDVDDLDFLGFMLSSSRTNCVYTFPPKNNGSIDISLASILATLIILIKLNAS